MRSLFGLCATAWFLGAAIIIGDGSQGVSGEPPNEAIFGDPVVMAIHLVARVLFVGVALASLALVDWAAVRGWLRSVTEPGGGA